ncbi:TVG1213972 [Thermoplasma volcanium GSS1]|uniref:TVG1213972 protein n=1 Tax=Thermoplasma volcanium (strain ATCC 51530 / DSM 4299 / JCM 9571 / NBRC 15438 / GSS1) TaxID=273116 RepID=Q979H7_THEVO|nr:hypothetical protein [Thermoplasma volcanium]BAB60326.1 TVG1213972 [Thermoplasma volcanium GSS1]
MAYSTADEGKAKSEIKANTNPYSQEAGVLYTLLFSVLLWWMPVIGPALAGYLGGRKSGSIRAGLISSLTVSGLFVIVSISLLPYKDSILGKVGQYISYGVLPISGSNLVSVSNLATYLYSSVGFAYTFFLLVPSSLMIVVIFSILGGFVSNLRRSETGSEEKLEPVEEDEDVEDNKYDYL